MLLYMQNALPRVKTNPVYKKPTITYDVTTLHAYYNKKHAFIYDEHNRRVVVSFSNVAVLLVSNDKNVNKLLFSLASNPEWNDNNDINYAIITSKSTIRRVYQIRNNLYKLSKNDTRIQPIILPGKQVIAYMAIYPKFLYYKLVKSTKGLRWEKYDELELYNRSNESKAEHQQIEQHIDDRYYLVGDQIVEEEVEEGIEEDIEEEVEEEEEEDMGKDENIYYRVYDELRIYDLYKRKIIEKTSTLGTIVYDYKSYRAFDTIWALDNGIFVIEDKIIVRPTVYVYQDYGAIAKISIDVPDDEQNEKTIEINLQYDTMEYVPVMLFCSKKNAVFITTRVIFVYDFDDSSSYPLETYELGYPHGGIDNESLKLYKYKNFFILLDKHHIIAVYYNKKDFQYYFKHKVSDANDAVELDEFSIIGHVLSHSDNNDCIGVVMASQRHGLRLIIYDANKKNIYISKSIKYDYLTAKERDIDLVLRIMLPEIKDLKFVLQPLYNFNLPNRATDITEEERINYLKAVIGKDTKIVRVGNGSYLPLNPHEFYRFKFFSYILSYEQPCLVQIKRLGV
jgi:hypothetical protein